MKVDIKKLKKSIRKNSKGAKMKKQAKVAVKKKSQLEKVEDSINKAVKEAKGGNVIQDCTMYGVKYDEEFAKVANNLALGFIENAKGMSKLADILSSSNVEIEALIKVSG